jgi:ABC-type uncharacterized transport system ATPase subunit
MGICNRVMVLRKGRVTGAAPIRGRSTRAKLAEMMIGRQIAVAYDKADVQPGDKCPVKYPATWTWIPTGASRR